MTDLQAFVAVMGTAFGAVALVVVGVLLWRDGKGKGFVEGLGEGRREQQGRVDRIEGEREAARREAGRLGRHAAELERMVDEMSVGYRGHLREIRAAVEMALAGFPEDEESEAGG